MKRLITVLFVFVIAMAMVIGVFADDVVVKNINNDQDMVVGDALETKGLYHSSDIGWYALHIPEIAIPNEHPQFSGEWIQVPEEDTNLLINGFSTYTIICIRLKVGESFTSGTWNQSRDVVVSFDKPMLANDYSYKYYMMVCKDGALALEPIDEEEQFLFSIMRQDFTREDSDYTSYLVHPNDALSYIRFGRLDKIVENFHNLSVGNSILYLLSKAGIE